MRYLVAFLLLLVITVSVVPVFIQDPGYVVIVYSGVSVETTLSFFIIALLLGLLLSLIIYRLIKAALGFPDFMFKRGQQRFAERSQESFYNGLVQLACGHWRHAEKLLLSSTEHGSGKLLAYLGAARAAQHQGEHERRDDYLMRAHGLSEAHAELATGLTQAELQIRQGQNERSLATLHHLNQTYHDNPYLLELLLQLYLQLGEWSRLRVKLPDFIKADIISVDRAASLEVESVLQQFRNAGRQSDIDKLMSDWEALPSHLKENIVIVRECARQLIELGAYDHAEPMLRTAIERDWSNELVSLYGQVRIDDSESQMAFADSWPEEFVDDASVQLALARICLHNQSEGKARFHLEASVEMGGSADAYFELASLLEQLNDQNAAQRCYQEGLKRAVESGYGAKSKK